MVKETLKKSCQSGRKLVSVLIDPDKSQDREMERLVTTAQECKVDYLFFGGSLLSKTEFSQKLQRIKAVSDIPVVIFPGHAVQVDAAADAILFLSLISGRNAEYLIGQQVVAAPFIKKAGLEVVSTGYMLVEGGRLTTAHYMSNTLPIPRDKPEIAANTALAAKMLGFDCLYLDAGSGAGHPVSREMVRQVKAATGIPLIVGGGLRNTKQVFNAVEAGADMIVVGNALEDNPNFLHSVSETVKAAG